MAEKLRKTVRSSLSEKSNAGVAHVFLQYGKLLVATRWHVLCCQKDNYRLNTR